MLLIVIFSRTDDEDDSEVFFDYWFTVNWGEVVGRRMDETITFGEYDCFVVESNS